MFCPVDRKGRSWPTVRCLKCGRVYSLHHSLPYPRLPLCIKHRKSKLTGKERTLTMWPDAVLDHYARPRS